MTAFVDVTGVIIGTRFTFRCPHCSMEHTWLAEQLMNMADTSIADYCSGCGGGFRVLKPGRSQTATARPSAEAPHARRRNEARVTGETRFQYKVVPFIGQSKGSVSASEVASQLESAISQHTSEGWEFYQLTDVNIEVQPGCLGGLFGATVQYVRFDQLIFRSPITE